MACQILRTQVGRNTSRAITIQRTIPLPPRPVGHRTLQPGGLNESPFAQSQSQTTAHTMTSTAYPIDQP